MLDYRFLLAYQCLKTIARIACSQQSTFYLVNLLETNYCSHSKCIVYDLSSVAQQRVRKQSNKISGNHTVGIPCTFCLIGCCTNAPLEVFRKGVVVKLSNVVWCCTTTSNGRVARFKAVFRNQLNIIMQSLRQGLFQN